jgi:hypothetical protein
LLLTVISLDNSRFGNGRSWRECGQADQGQDRNKGCAIRATKAAAARIYLAMASLPVSLRYFAYRMAPGPRHRQTLQITMTTGHVDNPADDVKFRRSRNRRERKIAAGKGYQDGGC